MRTDLIGERQVVRQPWWAALTVSSRTVLASCQGSTRRLAQSSAAKRHTKPAPTKWLQSIPLLLARWLAKKWFVQASLADDGQRIQGTIHVQIKNAVRNVDFFGPDTLDKHESY